MKDVEKLKGAISKPFSSVICNLSKPDFSSPLPWLKGQSAVKLPYSLTARVP